MILEAQNLSKKYKQASRTISVLEALNLEVEVGESVAILGKSGSGKSTLLSLLCGIERSDEGSVVYNGLRINELSEDEITKLRSQSIGVIFQQFHLIEHLNALENVMLPLEINGVLSPDIKALEALKLVGLGSRGDHFPAQLSGGERQRVAIARAIVNGPSLLLADEPSGSLDENTGNEVMDLIFNLVKNTKMALILVTHNNDLARHCDRVLILENGKLNDSKNNS